jgi:hypothetical protein
VKRSTSILVGCVLATGFGGAAFAQAGPSTTASLNSAGPWEDSWEAQRRDREITTRLNADTTYTARVQTVAGPAYVPDSRSVEVRPAEVERGSPWVATSREVWRETDAYTESLRVDSVGTLRRADGGPLPPGAGDAVAVEDQRYGLSYRRGWPSTLGYTASGLEVTLTPHAGVGLTPLGPVAEAGATLSIGSDVDRMVPEGQEVFGDRARWYLFAAGSGRAVGYNFARTRDGNYARSGYSHDSGAFLGDASIGVAYRRGDVHSSVGLVYREIEPGGMRDMSDGIEADVTEGMVAFQFSIKPDW